MLGGALAPGVGVGAEVIVVVRVGVTSPSPPQLISGTNSISASSRAIHLKATCDLVIDIGPSQAIYDLQVLGNLWHHSLQGGSKRARHKS